MGNCLHVYSYLRAMVSQVPHYVLFLSEPYRQPIDNYDGLLNVWITLITKDEKNFCMVDVLDRFRWCDINTWISVADYISKKAQYPGVF